MEQIARIVDFLWIEQHHKKQKINNAKIIRWLQDKYPNIFFSDIMSEQTPTNNKNEISHDTFRKYFYVHKNYLPLIDDYEGYSDCSISWHNTFNHVLEIKAILDEMRRNGQMNVGQPFHFMLGTKLTNNNNNNNVCDVDVKDHFQMQKEVSIPKSIELLLPQQESIFYLQCTFNTKERVNISFEDFIYKRQKLFNIIQHCYYHENASNLWFKYNPDLYIIKNWHMIHCETVILPSEDNRGKYEFCLISKILFHINIEEKIYNMYKNEKYIDLKKENIIIMINNEKLMEYISSHSIFKNIFVSAFYYPEDNIVNKNDISNIQEFI